MWTIPKVKWNDTIDRSYASEVTLKNMTNTKPQRLHQYLMPAGTRLLTWINFNPSLEWKHLPINY